MYKYETHLHTFPVSRCAIASVEESLKCYKELCYDGVFITNHFPDVVDDTNKGKTYEEKIKYYFSDYLWAVSLCCGLHCILLPSNKGSLLCFAITVCYGFIWELLQYASIFKGTGDLWDILMYILAGFTVLILNFISKKEKKHEKTH